MGDYNKEQYEIPLKDKCFCCREPIEKKPLSLCCKLDKIGKYGSAYQLHFEFVKFCIYFLMIMFFGFGIVNLYIYANGSDCYDSNEIKNHTILNERFN